eukprot:g14487.t1
MSSSTAVADNTQATPVAPAPTWYDDSVERITNPAAYARKHAPEPAPTPAFQEEITLAIPGRKTAKLEVHMLKERPFWSKVSLFWTFRLADVEGDGEAVVVSLVFDTWTGSIEISENAVSKVDEIQRPIMGGSWKTKTDFGQLEIKIVPFWTGYQYELWHEGKEVYTFFA